jgi:hypothetical protein
VAVAALEDIEGYGLVLGLLHRMPPPNQPEPRVARVTKHRAIIFEQYPSQQGSPVLKRHGGTQRSGLAHTWHDLMRDELNDLAKRLGDGELLGELAVIVLVLATVQGFLRDEVKGGSGELRVARDCGVTQMLLDRLAKHSLARWEKDRHRSDEDRDEPPMRVPAADVLGALQAKCVVADDWSDWVSSGREWASTHGCTNETRDDEYGDGHCQQGQPSDKQLIHKLSNCVRIHDSCVMK